MISTDRVCKSFGSILALVDATFVAQAGTVTIFTGADGAGKSTLFKILVGLVRKDSGEIFLNGDAIADHSGRISSICGYMPERFSLYLDLTVDENLNFFANIHGVPSHEREVRKKEMLDKTGMSPFTHWRAITLSGGMKQKLSLCCMLLASPKLIVLDEPTTGVDPLSRIEFFSIIDSLKREGKTILISTPYLDEAEKGDSVVFMKGGHILFQEKLRLLKENFPVRLLRITPKGNIFEVMDSLRNIPELHGDVYMRGNFIHYLQSGKESLLRLIPAQDVKEETPSLEDIYIYYERKQI